ncbi:MAG: hypothetical protein ACRC0G_15835 [Fusobacteriaceae bacterium]
MDLQQTLGIDKKTEKEILRMKKAREDIMKRLEEKDQVDFLNFIENKHDKVPVYLVMHFRDAVRAFADCEKFKLPKMQRNAKNKVLEAVKLDLKRVADLWEPSENLKLFTLLHETETILAKYIGVSSKFPDKYMEVLGKERGLSQEFVREQTQKLNNVEVDICIEYETAFVPALFKKFTDPMSHLVGSAVKILKFNDLYIDFPKLSTTIEGELMELRKKVTFKDIQLEEYLMTELYLNTDLRIREVAMQRQLANCAEVFDKKTIASLKGTLTRLDKLIEMHKKLVLTGEVSI